MGIPKKIVWLASYPKSGNTWFRAFLTALLNGGEVDINDMKTDGIFSSRLIFDYFTDLDSTILTDDEAKILQPEVFNQLSKDNNKNERLFIKVHDAYILNKLKLPIIPTESTYCAIYIIRNPLDIIPSLANHFNCSFDEAIVLLNNKYGCLSAQKNNKNTASQFNQLMFDWGGHAESWINQLNFPVLVIRYEDMVEQPLETFSKAIEFIGLQFEKHQIKKAIEETSFNKLQKQEKEIFFKESLYRKNMFFKSGKSGDWKKKLSWNQIKEITVNQEGTMKKYGY